KLFEAYKATRPGMPDELAHQLGWIKEISEALGARVLELDGYEADDIMGTLARMASEAGVETLIATGDKDMLQLVNPQTRVIMLGNSSRDTKMIDEKAVEAKYGIAAPLLPDFFALVGDAVDNVPGVLGIGPKTATALVSTYGGLEGIYAALEGIAPAKVQGALRANKERAFASRELVRVHKEVPLDVALGDLKRGAHKAGDVARLFARLNFRSLLGQVVEAPSESQAKPHIWGACPAAPGAEDGLFTREELDGKPAADRPERTAERARDASLACQGAVALELNQEAGPAALAPIAGVALACEKGEDHYFPFGRSGETPLALGILAGAAGPPLADPAVPKIVHDAKKACIGMHRLGLNLQGVVCDTMLARYLLNPGESSVEVEDVGLDYLGSTEGYDKRGQSGSQLGSVEEAAETCARRARTLLRVRAPMEADLQAKGLWKLFESLELPLAEVLAEMELRGVKTDGEHLLRLAEDFDSRLAMLEKEAHVLARHDFNLNSPRDVSQVLFDELGLKPRRKTKTGYSTDVGVLMELSAEHELPRKILDYRQIAKLKTTYVDQLLKFRDAETGRIHASFNQAVTATGRLSSSDPNLQNIPIRGDLGAEIRKAFVPAAEDWTLISGDYSQVELRVVAHLAGDEKLIAAFREGADIHTETAAIVFRVSHSAVTSEMRAVAKVVNFGIIYGMGAQALAKTTGLALEEATRFLDEHRRTYPGLYGYLDRVIQQGRALGYVETILGRKRFLPALSSSDSAVRSAAERAAINTPVQGSAADIIKLAMLGVHRSIKRKHLLGGIVVQVHDEILVECPEGERAEMEGVLYNEMTNAYSLAVPLKVDLKAGKNWYETH
ncbi:MAG TPA: DNA polymerase I, partial [bacterium]|nr:DNA polymerase I [bacterium]